MLPEIALPIVGIVERAPHGGFPATDALAGGERWAEFEKHMSVIGHHGCGENSAVTFGVPSLERVEQRTSGNCFTQPRFAMAGD